MDIEMPVLNGKDAALQIRSIEKEYRLDETKIIFVSGNTLKKEIEECLDKNGKIRGAAFLRKPLSFDEFQSTVRNLFK